MGYDRLAAGRAQKQREQISSKGEADSQHKDIPGVVLVD